MATPEKRAAMRIRDAIMAARARTGEDRIGVSVGGGLHHVCLTLSQGRKVSIVKLHSGDMESAIRFLNNYVRV